SSYIELGELKSLRSLDLSGNLLPYSSLTVISKIRSLTHLRFYDLNLDAFPLEICKHLHHLKLLGLSNNNLKCLPKEIVNFTKLQELYLKENRFEHFPLELCQLFIPDEISSLQNLSQFYLACNKLTMVPDSLSKCYKLSVLDLSTNKLHKLPRSLKQLTEMKEFSISGNALAGFPRPLRHWKSLTVIYLKNCGLKVLWAWLGGRDMAWWAWQRKDTAKNPFPPQPTNLLSSSILLCRATKEDPVDQLGLGRQRIDGGGASKRRYLPVVQTTQNFRYRFSRTGQNLLNTIFGIKVKVQNLTC
uniref:Uncharacterized protein n=1 Tax=Pseudonaja textilis TaxID=8673 RepID=A0A670Z5L1_PSETE